VRILVAWNILVSVILHNELNVGMFLIGLQGIKAKLGKLHNGKRAEELGI
jgi:hypothetical protein